MKTIFILCFFLMSFAASALTPDLQSLWEKRDEKVSLASFLTTLEAKSHDDPESLGYLCRGYFLLGDVHTQDKDEKLKILWKAKEYGERGFDPKQLDKATEKQIDVIYWTAASLGRWSKLNGIFSSLRYKDTIIELIKRVEALNPKYFHGAVPRFWGSFYAVAPGIAGGDMKKSKENFQKALEIAPESLTTKVLMAEVYWTKKDDKDEFKKTLEEVLKADLGPKDLWPENRMEKMKAKKMLENVGDYF